MKHILKCLPWFFQAAWVGDKTFEIRKDDRGFNERDEIVLQEWDPKEGYTGREIEGVIKYMTNFEQKENYVVFSFETTGRTE